MRALEGRTPTALVTDADRGSALAIMRSFNRKGWRVIAGASDPLSPGLQSRHVQERLLYPPPKEAAAQYVETMLNAVQEKGVDLVIPVTDETILPLAHERQRFEEICRLAMPETPILEATRNKHQTVKMARRLGVPVPATFAAHTVEEAVECAQTLQWPVVLKPAFSRKYDAQAGKIEVFSVAYANDMEMLKKEMKAYEGRCPVLVQEYYRGNGQGVELLACDGQPLAVFQHRRLCEIPVQGGASALRQSVALDAQLYDYTRCLTEALNWTGLLMVEFKVGEEGAKLMEINGRVWGSLPLAVASGMDFPGRLATLYEKGEANLDNIPERDYRIGVQAADVEMLLMWILQVLWGQRSYDFLPFPARHEAFPVLLKLISPRLKYDVLSLSDPRPGIATLLKIGRKFFRKLSVLA